MNERQLRGYRHGEAFCLMWYECRNKQCGHRERIWNSRDGVTPFGMQCPSCGDSTLNHAYFGSDVFAPDHKLRVGQRYWRDGTPDEAAFYMQQRINRCVGTEWECTQAMAAELIGIARSGESGESSEFGKGWPMLDIYMPPLEAGDKAP